MARIMTTYLLVIILLGAGTNSAPPTVIKQEFTNLTLCEFARDYIVSRTKDPATPAPRPRVLMADCLIGGVP
jgi:hypothetical protein